MKRKKFGELIYNILESRNLPQSWLAEQTDMDPAYLSRLISEGYNPQKKTIAKINDALREEIRRDASGKWVAHAQDRADTLKKNEVLTENYPGSQHELHTQLGRLNELLSELEGSQLSAVDLKIILDTRNKLHQLVQEAMKLPDF